MDASPSKLAGRRAFVLGGSSPLGEAIIACAASLGAQTVGLSRSRPAGSTPRLQLNLHDPDALRSLALRDGDLLFSAAPLWDFAQALSRAGELPAGLTVVAVSSASAFTKSDSRIPYDAGLARRLAESEALIFSLLTTRAHVLRPTIIYGSGRDRSIVRLAGVLRRWRAFPLVRNGRGRRAPIHVDDLARIAVHLTDHPSAGRALHAPGAEILTFREMLDRLAKALHVRWCAIRLPGAATEGLARMLPQRSLAGRSLAAITRTGEDLIVPDEVAHVGVTRRPFTADARALGLTS